MEISSFVGLGKWTSKRNRKHGSRIGNSSRTRSNDSLLPPLQIIALEDRTVPSTLTVTSAADDNSAGTLRTVVAGAQSGDTIQFARSLRGNTITLIQGELTVSQDLNINGPGATTLSISGGGVSRVFNIGASATVTISGLTLADGLAADGAGVLNGGILTLSDDVLSTNLAQGVSTGGLFGDNGGRGGGIENQPGASLRIVDTLFADNQAIGGPNGGNAFGGGIDNEAGAVSIDQSLFSGNQAVGGSGGLIGVAATLPGGISASLLGVGAGGGIWNDGGVVTIANSSMSENQSQGGNNGDASSSTAKFVLVGTAIGGAVGSGAFFTTAMPDLSITNSTLKSNESQGGSNVVVGVLFGDDAGNGRGGGVGAIAGDVSISDTTVRNNLAQSGALFTVVRGGNAVQAFASSALGGGIDDEFDLGFTLTFPATAPAALNITNSSVRDNVAFGNGPSAAATGGGVATQRVNAQFADCTVSSNQALGGAGGGFFTSGRTLQPATGGSVQGGGIASFQGSLTMSGSSVKDNLALGGLGGTPGNGSGFGGPSSGGGVDFSGSSLSMSYSTLRGNQAISGDATLGTGFFLATGSNASRGGGLLSSATSANITGTNFVDNISQGGAGLGSFGGAATGGGALLAGSTLVMSQCTFVGDQAIGGAGGIGVSGIAAARGGIATAGGLETTVKNATIGESSFVHDQAMGGAGGIANIVGARGGNGGAAGGGALVSQPSSSSATITTALSACDFIHDLAQGGDGGTGSNAIGGAGGNGSGGALLDTLVTFQLSTTTITDCDFVGNLAVGGAGNSGAAGGNATGGGASEIAALTLSNDSFTLNRALAGAGGGGINGGPGGPGGISTGGGFAIMFGSIATIEQTQFIKDLAQGGSGGTGDGGGPGGVGGAGLGGAVANSLSTTALGSCTFLENVAEGGTGGDGGVTGNGGAGGDGRGGAAYNALANGKNFVPQVASLSVSGSAISQNEAIGGAGGVGGIGGTTGNGEGGGLFDASNGFAGQATLALNDCFIQANAAEGGAASLAVNGGNGFGGGIFIDANATATVLTSVIVGNQAQGGSGGVGASDGQGVGGGVYNLGTFMLDGASVVANNRASSSDDDVFGPTTPI
jgi:hypothetical protein